MKSIKKLFMFTCIAIILLAGLFFNSNNVSANTVADDSIPTKTDFSNEIISTPNEIGVRMVNPYRYKKQNVKTSYSWSSYKRVSDSITTGKKGGSISVTKTVSFKTDISGSTYGISVDLGRTQSSTRGYTLNADPNTRSYMGYRVRYKVETGTKVRTDMETGAQVKTKYTVKAPQHGDYKLIKTK